MGTIIETAKLALGREDAFGRVLAGGSGNSARAMWQATKATEETGKGIGKHFGRFIREAKTQTDTFESAMHLMEGVDKNVIKGIKKAGKTDRAFYQKIVDLFRQGKSLDAETIKTTLNVSDDVAKTVLDNAGKIAANSADDVAGAAIKSGKGLFKSLKGKGGTIGAILTIIMEVPNIIKAFKNGDGLQQVGRSTLNVGGFAAGAAAGAAIGSIIPVAGTAIGAIVGGLCGIIGGMAGGWVAEKAGNAIFGKSIEEQKEAAAEQQATQEAPQATSQYYPSNSSEIGYYKSLFPQYGENFDSMV